MRYQYHDLYDKQFEDLVVAICAELLGSGVQPFSSGPDGGRDARFEGTAANFPSPHKPLSGKFVIQAKHTDHPYAKFSAPDFAGTQDSSVLSKEIPKIRKLVDAGELDNYFLVSNRRLAGTADEKIRRRIRDETGAKVVELFGVERIDHLLKTYPEISDKLDLSAVNAPSRVTSEDLAAVIGRLALNSDLFAKASSVDELVRTSFDRKNEQNRLDEDFAEEILSKYLPSTSDWYRNGDEVTEHRGPDGCGR